MKEHLERLKCLRQSMPQKMDTEVTGFFEGATPSICLRVAATTTEQEVDRHFSLLLTEKVEERHREHSGGRDNRLNRNSLFRDKLCLENITCDAYFATIKRILPFCDSQSVNGFGNSSSGYRVSKTQPTLSWETPALQKAIGQGSHRIHAIQGYRVPFNQQPYQTCPPRALIHPQAGDWMTKVDLKDTYFMVPINKDRAFLKFSFK